MQETRGKYTLGFDGKHFLLESKKTDCLAKDNCGIPPEKMKVKIGEWKAKATSCCSPDSGCC